MPELSQPVESLPVTSSMPMDMPEKQAALFRELLTALEEKHVRTRSQEHSLCANIRESAVSPRIWMCS